MTRCLVAVLFVVGCETEGPGAPEPVSPSLEARTEEGPATPTPEPSTADGKPLEAAGAPTRAITMQELKTTAPGTSVTVPGFLVSVKDHVTIVSTDEGGLTPGLRCEGAEPHGVPPHTPVSVTGTTSQPEGDLPVLKVCSVRPTGTVPEAGAEGL